jgi:hypothetical protein
LIPGGLPRSVEPDDHIWDERQVWAGSRLAVVGCVECVVISKHNVSRSQRRTEKFTLMAASSVQKIFIAKADP